MFRRAQHDERPDDGRADIPHQMAFIAWSDDFHDLDAAALALLTPEQRQAQVTARHALWQYADALWDAAKASGNPVTMAELAAETGATFSRYAPGDHTQSPRPLPKRRTGDT